MGPPPTTTRRTVLGLAGAGVLGAVGGGHEWHRRGHVDAPRHGLTVALRSTGERLVVDDLDQVVPGTRVAAGDPHTSLLLEREVDWLGRCAAWTRAEAPFASLLDGALRDLYVLSNGLDAPVAGWPAMWRYVWPRDTAHVVVAWHEVGRQDLVTSHLATLARLVRKRPVAARYRVTGGVPDARADQLDGPGFLLWALSTTRASWEGSRHHTALAALARHCAEQLLAAVDGRDLPPAGPDYWEVPTRSLTLGIAGPVLVGLEAAAAELGTLGAARVADRASRAAERVGEGVHRSFGEAGYPRSEGGGPRDAAVAFLQPPYRPLETVGADLRLALARATHEMRRPNGGLAPGGGWRQDGVAWTPETLLFARARAGLGERTAARRWLTWVDEHRTSAGSVPEKVRWDGTPAGPAPLAWSAALVVSTVAALRAAGEGR